MSDEKRGPGEAGSPSGMSVPPEARRRGGMDTLFSAPWFDENAVQGEAPKKNNTVLIVAVVVGVVVLLPMLMCGLSVIAGVAFYLLQTGAL